MPHDNAYARLSDFEATHAEFTAIRRHLHAHPELSHEEVETARFVAEKLQAFGYEVTTGIGGHGLVARMKVGTGSRSIGIRADMDALPILEETGLDYASTSPGKMHACGHDGHTTTLLAAAEYLARTRRFSGTLNLIFQPAEEASGRSGAQRMIADGLFTRFPCDAVYGLHNHPGVEQGHIMIRPGAIMAASDTARITVIGRGGHASRPHLAIDPVYIACLLVVSLQSVVSRSIDPTQTSVVTVGAIHAGEAANVIPETATLALSIRSFDAGIRDRLQDRITSLATSTAAGHGARVEVDYMRGTPVVVNSKAETALIRQVAEELLGEDKVSLCPLIPGSEDFAYMLEECPGSFVRLGNGLDSAFLHNPRYNFDDANIPVGAALWARLAERYLSE
ncbi:M20 aminoacylase family protein [Rhizobium sp. SSA_523]|uniref:M20 aminoacylase family protein n=1 Tax=Rhizobium sp. SSA_523 TaxID=2952477 RepID=UPI002091C115|nr:M20 aminoacylase family protein [Rhizobium sp. SSA_523]MCO5732532.1 M20 family metallopeptidase [Rhizobium sp. SSA_523]WKC22329.1 M20 aminoacylase family protein [Rhizobium sp. SSA_523]